jgi:hypothetical protein
MFATEGRSTTTGTPAAAGTTETVETPITNVFCKIFEKLVNLAENSRKKQQMGFNEAHFSPIDLSQFDNCRNIGILYLQL